MYTVWKFKNFTAVQILREINVWPEYAQKQQFWKINGLLLLISVVQKLKDFSVIHILREINFGDSRSPKIAYLVILGALDFANLVNFGTF